MIDVIVEFQLEFVELLIVIEESQDVLVGLRLRDRVDVLKFLVQRRLVHVDEKRGDESMEEDLVQRNGLFQVIHRLKHRLGEDLPLLFIGTLLALVEHLRADAFLDLAHQTAEKTFDVVRRLLLRFDGRLLRWWIGTVGVDEFVMVISGVVVISKESLFIRLLVVVVVVGFALGGNFSEEIILDGLLLFGDRQDVVARRPTKYRQPMRTIRGNDLLQNFQQDLDAQSDLIGGELADVVVHGFNHPIEHFRQMLGLNIRGRFERGDVEKHVDDSAQLLDRRARSDQVERVVLIVDDHVEVLRQEFPDEIRFERVQEHVQRLQRFRASALLLTVDRC